MRRCVHRCEGLHVRAHVCMRACLCMHAPPTSTYINLIHVPTPLFSLRPPFRFLPFHLSFFPSLPPWSWSRATKRDKKAAWSIVAGPIPPAQSVPLYIEEAPTFLTSAHFSEIADAFFPPCISDPPFTVIRDTCTGRVWPMR